MAGSFTVTASALRDKANELRNQNKNLRSQIEALRGQESGLRGLWEGEAHESFSREFTKDMSKLDQFCSAIDDYSNKLDMIAQEYEKAERTNTQIANTRV